MQPHDYLKEAGEAVLEGKVKMFKKSLAAITKEEDKTKLVRHIIGSDKVIDDPEKSKKLLKVLIKTGINLDCVIEGETLLEYVKRRNKVLAQVLEDAKKKKEESQKKEKEEKNSISIHPFFASRISPRSNPPSPRSNPSSPRKASLSAPAAIVYSARFDSTSPRGATIERMQQPQPPASNPLSLSHSSNGSRKEMYQRVRYQDETKTVEFIHPARGASQRDTILQ